MLNYTIVKSAAVIKCSFDFDILLQKIKGFMDIFERLHELKMGPLTEDDDAGCPLRTPLLLCFRSPSLIYVKVELKKSPLFQGEKTPFAMLKIAKKTYAFKSRLTRYQITNLFMLPSYKRKCFFIIFSGKETDCSS